MTKRKLQRIESQIAAREKEAAKLRDRIVDLRTEIEEMEEIADTAHDYLVEARQSIEAAREELSRRV